MLSAVLAVALAASLQGRYDAARNVVESSRDAHALAAARAEISAVERADGAPRGRHARVPAFPPSWTQAHAAGRRDGLLSARLAAIGSRFGGTSAIWVHDLRTGRVAAWNADALVPAASSVKLAALAAALHSRRADLRYDAEQLAEWSSNLAANRIVELLGYARISRAMRALGMWHSTYPGPYRVGTGIGTVHTRVTTAHDLGRALFALHTAARVRGSFLTRGQARLALDLLRRSLPYGDNQGLLRPWLHGVAVAEKNGWTSDTRITAAVVYRAEGPLIVVVASYRPALKRYAARALGRDVLRALGMS
jgi:hypothetical protein